MTEEKYQILNSYLNDFFVKMKNENPIFIDELRNLCYLSDMIMANFEGSYKKEYKKCDITMTAEDVYNIAKEVIGTIDKKYLEDYENIYENGILDFSYEREYPDSCFKWINYYGKMSYEININRYFDYQDISTLIHEFFHYINRNVVKTINYKFLGEFISIYFEEYAKRYLMNKRNLTSEDVSLNERIVEFLTMNNSFNSYCLVLLAYEKLGNISSSTVNELKNILQYTDNSFEKECLDIVDIIENKGTDALYNNWMFLYKYIIGTILAYYVLEHCQLEDMVKLNDLMNNECSFNMSIYEILNTIGIKINNDLVYESFDIMKKILNKNRLTK